MKTHSGCQRIECQTTSGCAHRGPHGEFCYFIALPHGCICPPTSEQTCDPWSYFNFDLIMQEALLRQANAKQSSAEAITPEMRTLNYWIAHVAHANALACLVQR